MLLFPPRKPVDGRPANNPLASRLVLAPDADALGVRGFDRAMGLPKVRRAIPTPFAGGASSGEVLFIPRELDG